jgi:hypothetical protein
MGGGGGAHYDREVRCEGREMASSTQRFRKLVQAYEILIQPGIRDGFNAPLVQQMGFKSAAVSGAGLRPVSADAGAALSHHRATPCELRL